MKNWLTTHYPHPDPDNLLWHIYLKKSHRNAVDGMEIGDRVFFYEYKYQKPLKDGTEHPLGRVGIVRVGFVSGEIYTRSKDTATAEYADGTVSDWLWGIPVRDHNCHGFISRFEVLKVLDYKPSGYLRGFNGGTGVMQLTDEQGQSLAKIFNQRR